MMIFINTIKPYLQYHPLRDDAKSCADIQNTHRLSVSSYAHYAIVKMNIMAPGAIFSV